MSAVAKCRATSFKRTTGGMRSNDASGDNFIIAFAMCVFSGSGVDDGLRSPRPGCRANISVSDSSHNSLTSINCTKIVPQC